MQTRFLAPLILSTVLAGCSLNTPVPDAGISVPTQWNSQPADSAWPADDWWQAYQSAPLEQLVERARLSNLDLATAASRLLQADAQNPLTEKVMPYAEMLGCSAELAGVSAILRDGASYERQRRVHAETGSLEAIVRSLAAELRADVFSANTA